MIWLNDDSGFYNDGNNPDENGNSRTFIRTKIGCKTLYKTQKIGGLWSIISMEGIYEKDSLTPVSPADGIIIPKEEITKFRPSYANMSYALSKIGYSVDVNLPGIDKPEMVAKLYQESENWLNS